MSVGKVGIMTTFDEAISPVDRREMVLRGNALGCVWVAAKEDYRHQTLMSKIALSRTVAAAANHGIDETLLIETIQLARKEEP